MAKGKPVKPANPAKRQVSALSLRRDRVGNLQVLLITTRRTQRWIIPRGWPMKSLDDAEAAAQELEKKLA